MVDILFWFLFVLSILYAIINIKDYLLRNPKTLTSIFGLKKISKTVKDIGLSAEELKSSSEGIKSQIRELNMRIDLLQSRLPSFMKTDKI